MRNKFANLDSELNPYALHSNVSASENRIGSLKRTVVLIALLLGLLASVFCVGFSVWFVIELKTELGRAMGDAFTSPEFEAELQRAVITPASSQMLVDMLNWMLQRWGDFVEPWNASVG